MRVVFKIKRYDEIHLNRHIPGSQVTIQLDRRAAKDALLYEVEGAQEAVDRFMGKIDWLQLDILVSEGEESMDLGLDALSEALEVLDGSVTKLRKALATGDYDMYLEALLEAEQAGKTRKTAVEAIEERISGR
tara:strand:- start:92 stop:490 length:399 start_codon:yes stop_codon:yes gene_type:complete